MKKKKKIVISVCVAINICAVFYVPSDITSEFSRKVDVGVLMDAVFTCVYIV